jgi:hypothetical protein
MTTKYRVEVQYGDNWHALPMPLKDTKTGAEAFIYTLERDSLWAGCRFRAMPVSVPE